ncbi:hypothetical protein MtrunA17_Chr8g0392241 [Medicago truncatula]|uniref:Uncharacterized protein n=1 Tax=Medicago truncatula TaxID=3880 RepID=A0A396GWH7_MEDTR|nr:hypothetical protein MtrunA17_Chr8g0392241 [Medicago truncatula]
MENEQQLPKNSSKQLKSRIETPSPSAQERTDVSNTEGPLNIIEKKGIQNKCQRKPRGRPKKDCGLPNLAMNIMQNTSINNPDVRPTPVLNMNTTYRQALRQNDSRTDEALHIVLSLK